MPEENYRERAWLIDDNGCHAYYDVETGRVLASIAVDARSTAFVNIDELPVGNSAEAYYNTAKFVGPDFVAKAKVYVERVWNQQRRRHAGGKEEPGTD